MTTPENKTYVFKIPKNAKSDSRGFYIIDKQFKDENPEIDFNYLNHDLNYRGLNVQNNFYECHGVKVIIPECEIKHIRGPIAKKSDNWNEQADQWSITIKGLSFDYYTGIGHRKNDRPVKPDPIDLLYSLVSDASACDESFDDWCSNYGYDTDSRKALDTYLKCQENALKLRKMGFNLSDLQTLFQDY